MYAYFVIIILVFFIPSALILLFRDFIRSKLLKKQSQQKALYLEQLKIDNVVKILDHTRQGDMLIAHVLNISTWLIEELHIAINFYNENGHLIGNSLAKVNNLSPGETWEMKQPIEIDHVANYSIANITVPRSRY